MKVIFLSDVPRVGRKYDVKEINDGYAMNFLLPRKLAVVATPKELASLEKRQKDIVLEREVQEDLLMKSMEEIKSKVVSIKAKANDKGHLFSAIHKKEIMEAMQKENRVTINEEYIDLEKPIKEVGEFDVPIKIGNKKSSFKLVIEATK
ncbi:MAG: 50S ribosomal protein L9 [Candidatus Pacebacteria bacterium]|nr:50S ribosomal protein L9 [Candidatus Paceibacterota bacterium]